MALIKVIKIGDELIFDLNQIAPTAKKEIRVMLTEKTGRMAVIKITADRSIPIRHFKSATITQGIVPV